MPWTCSASATVARRIVGGMLAPRFSGWHWNLVPSPRQTCFGPKPGRSPWLTFFPWGAGCRSLVVDQDVREALDDCHGPQASFTLHFTPDMAAADDRT